MDRQGLAQIVCQQHCAGEFLDLPVKRQLAFQPVKSNFANADKLGCFCGLGKFAVHAFPVPGVELQRAETIFRQRQIRFIPGYRNYPYGGACRRQRLLPVKMSMKINCGQSRWHDYFSTATKSRFLIK